MEKDFRVKQQVMNYYDRETLDLFYEGDRYGLPYFSDEKAIKMVACLKNVSVDDLVVVNACVQPNAKPDIFKRYVNGPWEADVVLPAYLEGLLVRSGGILMFEEQLKDILRSGGAWTNEEALNIIELMKGPNATKLNDLLDEFVRQAMHSPYFRDLLSPPFKRGCMSDLWNYLVANAPYIVSYKHSFACVHQAYETAYNLTHR